MSGTCPELSVRPLALILPTDAEMELWETLSDRQRQYALHWMRSNRTRLWNTELETIVRKAKGQRP